jgi:hypothetical protein
MVTTDWLYVEVTVDEDGFFGLVVPNPPQYERRKLQALALYYMGTKLNGLGLNAVLLQLRFQEIRHTNDIITASRITRYAGVNQHQDPGMLSDLANTSGSRRHEQGAG